MRLVIDTNIVIAALIKDNISRKIIFDSNFSFVSPDFIYEEISNHKKEILQKSKIHEIEFEVLINILLEKIEVIPFEDYKTFLNQSKELITDIDDISFLAVALAKKCSIWSEDKHFEQQNKVKIYKTKDLINY
jgi:predicted nucleic acid-binding protein